MKEEALKQIMAYVEQTAEFTKEQAPLVAQEILSSGYIACGIWSGVAVVAFIVFLFFVFGVYFCTKKDNVETCILMSFVSGLFTLFVSLSNIYCWLYMIYCPRLYVLSNIKDLLK